MSSQPARLGIVHLLMWTAGCAAMLAAQRLPPLGDSQYELNAFTRTMQVLTAMIEGAALAGLGTVIVEWLRGRAFPVQPGEWLLVACGASVALDLSIRVVTRLSVSQIQPLPAAAIAFLPATLVSVAIYGWAFRKCWSNLEWAPLFSTSAIVQALLLIGIFLWPAGNSSAYAAPIVGILGAVCSGYLLYNYPNAIMHDLRHHTARGVWHWIGVILLPLHTAAYYMSLWFSLR